MSSNYEEELKVSFRLTKFLLEHKASCALYLRKQ